MNLPSYRTFIGAAFVAIAAVACTGPGATPAAPTGAPVTVNVVLTSASCAPDRASVPAGSVTFNVTNQGADAVSELELLQNERVIAEKENLTPGLSGTFTVTLAAGSYVLECPGAATDESVFEVTAAGS